MRYYNQSTTKEFIEKAKLIHGDKYDYSKVEYTNAHTKISIICPIHGEFNQTPTNHLSGYKCFKCSGQGKTTESFIEEIKKIHGDRYDYSKVEYKDWKTRITIICPIHGEFEQRASDHLSGSGCPRCGGTLQSNTEEFIEKAKLIHGDKYDYSKVEYKRNIIKVCIVCPIHGEFGQRPDKHLVGCGCPQCAGNIQLTTEEFIEKAKLIHGDKYDYSKVEYINGKTKVCIICPEHGEFKQLPTSHLRGTNCHSCQRQSNFESYVEDFFKNKNIKYTKEQTFEWLKYKKPMFLDFFLKDYNIGIEVQGRQHFKQIRNWDDLNSIIKRDKIKNELSQKNNINLIYFTDYIGNVDHIGIYNEQNLFTDLELLLNQIKGTFKS